jgi:HAD superfamily hydrolase (TIGR01509 family)
MRERNHPGKVRKINKILRRVHLWWNQLCSLTACVTIPSSLYMKVFIPPEKRYAGYIFDCDGTLADSMPAHYRAWAATVQKHGGQMPEDLFYKLGGWPSKKMIEHLNALFGTSLDPDTVADEKERFYVAHISTIQPIPEVVSFAREVAEFAKVSVASGGVLAVVTQTIAAIGVTDLFPVIVTSEQVSRGKPFPDMFLEAARRMGVTPADCLVLEDSPAGFEAAEAAGMDYAVVERPQRSCSSR